MALRAPLLLLAALALALAVSPAAGSKLGRSQLVGGLMDADVSEAGVQQALNYALSEYNQASNDAYHSRVLRVLRARKQVRAAGARGDRPGLEMLRDRDVAWRGSGRGRAGPGMWPRGRPGGAGPGSGRARSSAGRCPGLSPRPQPCASAFPGVPGPSRPAAPARPGGRGCGSGSASRPRAPAQPCGTQGSVRAVNPISAGEGKQTLNLGCLSGLSVNGFLSILFPLTS